LARKTRRREQAPCQQKAATAGHGGGDGFSQYETTDVPMWPRPKTYFPSEKSRRWVEISDSFSIRTL
jgi:hypothetical protein